MERVEMILKYKDFVRRQKKVGRSSHDIFSMACAYLEACCEADIIDYSELSSLREFAENVADEIV